MCLHHRTEVEIPLTCKIHSQHSKYELEVFIQDAHKQPFHTYSLHAAQYFSKSYPVFSQSRNSPHFMEQPEGLIAKIAGS